MLDKKVKLHGIIFLCSTVGGVLSLWSMFSAISYKLSSKYQTTSIALTSIIVISTLIVCLVVIFHIREEYLPVIYTLLGLSILITLLNIIHGCVIGIKGPRYLVLSLSFTATIESVICTISASVLSYYYKKPIPTDTWYNRYHWP
uniref:MARVEL domain-containing protein n=1 Tax=Strongyloides venezuelensis TaxID=75913 RepID=A0A0K0F3A1_STRVS